jgi:hypothetical protein
MVLSSLHSLCLSGGTGGVTQTWTCVFCVTLLVQGVPASPGSCCEALPRKGRHVRPSPSSSAVSAVGEGAAETADVSSCGPAL